MGWFSKSKAYDDGYAKGHLSNEDLAELGHTKETFIKHVEDTYTRGPNTFLPRFPR